MEVSLRYIIVDDNREFLSSAERLLSSQGATVVGQASSGAEATELVQTLNPDVTLVDVELGEEDGIELARRLTAINPQAAVVLISLREQDEIAELIEDSGALGFIAKADLGVDAIADLIRQRRPRDVD
jgi:two-component system nitrate/nitrite response regulator NarL